MTSALAPSCEVDCQELVSEGNSCAGVQATDPSLPALVEVDNELQEIEKGFEG